MLYRVFIFFTFANMRKNLFIILLFYTSFFGINSAFANEPFVTNSIDTIQTESISFMDNLLEKDSLTGAFVIIHQDSLLELLINTPRTNKENNNYKGFRVQLFSSNTAKIAKERAFAIEKRVLQKHPDLTIYVSYNAPFWKVRVGDCTTYNAATKLRQYLVNEFPDLQTEIYIVPDQINIK